MVTLAVSEARLDLVEEGVAPISGVGSAELVALDVEVGSTTMTNGT